MQSKCIQYNLIQWNCRSVRGKEEEILSFCNINDIDLFAFNETWLDATDDFYMNGFICNRLDRIGRGGGVMILSRKELYVKQIAFVNLKFEAVGAIVIINNIMTSIVTVYIPPNNNNIIKAADFESFFQQITPPMIIVGDFNAHSRLWGCHDDNQRGFELIDALNSSNLIFLNNGDATRIAAPPMHSSAVDLALCSAHFGFSATWSTIKDHLSSDHLPTITNLKFNPTISQENKQNIFNNTVWPLFEKKCNELFFHQNEILNVNEAYDSFVCKVTDALIFAEKKSSKFKHKSYWWDEECTNKISIRKDKFINFRLVGTKEAYMELKREIAQTKKFLKEKKSKGWEKFCKSIKDDRSLKLYWRMAMHFAKRSSGGSSVNQSDWFDGFCKKLAPPWTAMKMSFDTMDDPLDPLLASFSMCHLKTALDNTNNTAAGLDGIKFKTLIALPESGKKWLLDIFNKILISGEVPVAWCRCKIIPIPKPNSADNIQAQFQPISLLNCTRKLFEKMLHARLEWWVESKNFLGPHIYGFRRNRSTNDCLNIMLSEINTSFVNKKMLAVLFLDFKGAFDNVRIEVLCGLLMEIGLPCIIVKIMWCLLADRELHFVVNGSTKEVRNTSIGLPQGSILSPLLFNIYSSKFCNVLPPNLKVIQYADDTVIYKADNSIASIEEDFNDFCENLTQWTLDTGLEISPEKSKLLVFSRKHIAPVISMQYNGVDIPMCSEYKYLGVIWDRKLNWNAYVDYLKTKLIKSFNFLKVIASTQWGNKFKCSIIIFKCVIRAVIEYFPAALLVMSSAKFCILERIQNKCLRAITGAMNTTPINNLQLLCGIPPMMIRSRFLQSKFYLKLVIRKKNSTLAFIIERM